MKTSIACFLAVAFSTLAAAPAEADAKIETYERNASVYVADLDLATERDAYVLYERIGYAARAICAADELSFETQRRPHWRQCVAAAIDNAVDRAGAPLLTAVHLQRRDSLARL